MKAVHLLFLGCCLWAFNAWPAQPVEIYTYDELPPYAYRDGKGELTGVYIDIVKTAISRMPDYEATFQVVPWSRAKSAAKSGKAFAILPPYFHAHDWLTDTHPRRPYIWPYSLPLYVQKDVVICVSEVLKQPREKYPEDFAGAFFVMWRGDGRAGEKFNSMVENRLIKVQYVDSIYEAARLLAYGRADCTVTSRLPFAWYMAKLKETNEYQSFSKITLLQEAGVISTNEGYLGYTNIDDEKNFPFKEDFAIKFDIEIYKMKRSGELDDIIHRFVDVNFMEQLQIEY